MESFRKHTIAELDRDFTRLNSMKCVKNYKSNLYGQKIIDHFTFRHKIKTQVHGHSFYDMYNDPNKRKKLIEISTGFGKTEHTMADLYSAFAMSIKPYSVFKVSFAKFLYCKFKPKQILDPFSGFGERLLGALSLGINYIGIDTNKDLLKPLKKMTKKFNINNAKIKLITADSAKVDFSKFKYDFVLTSPPFFYIEKYRHMPKYNDDHAFTQHLYEPVFTNVFNNMEESGMLCIHMNEKLLFIISAIIGRKFDVKIKYPIRKIPRKKYTDYTDYLYCWRR